MALPTLQPERLFYMELCQGEDLDAAGWGQNGLLISPVSGGFFEGEKLKGKIAGIGAAYTFSQPPDKNQIEMKLLLQTEDGVDILLEGDGMLLIDPGKEQELIEGRTLGAEEYYYRFRLRFQTEAEKYTWLTERLWVAIAGIKDWQTICLEAYSI